MPIRVYRRKGSEIYSYAGTVAGRRLRGSTGTTDKIRAERIAAEKETAQWKCDLDGPSAVLTFAKAALLYRAAGKVTNKRSERYLSRVEDYWKDTLVKNIKAGAIKQSAIEMHPNDSGATRNRQVITVTQAVINHCAELELCPPIKVRRFKFDRKIKKPILVNWLDVFCAHADPEMSALALFMFSTGCRISEARRLEWADIDFQNRVVLVRETKMRFQRLPRMPHRLLVALANLPRDAKPFGRPESSLRRSWDAVIAAAAASSQGFTRLTFHSCRHGIATKLLRDGVDVKTIGQMIGMSAAVLLSTYGHAMQDDTIIDGVFDTPLTQPILELKKINDLE